MNNPVLVADREQPSAAHGAVRLFNRFELKYIADRTLVARVRDEFSRVLTPDAHGVDGFYPVWSCYYDTPDLRFYWEKIDGERFRRKLRIRHYGPPETLTPDTPVWVEIKQRVNRATQKRRARLPYSEALRLCSGLEPQACDPGDERFVEEILVLVAQLRLIPVSVVGYVREAFLGAEEDGRLRVTVDSHIRGRDRDLDLGMPSENRFVVHPELSVMELKVNERVPYWLTECVARHNLQLVRLSKYCQSIEAYGRAPRSASHVPEE
ncbi:MAG: polyphosphate polymerase domain-containing protein [Chloroflexi bacterium]|nr:polyphosphate polymerase domain-containing protein [Chloroflexota bacterium]